MVSIKLQSFVSVIVTIYCPAETLVKSSVIEPLFQAKVYGLVPPEGVSLNYDNVTAYVELKKRIEFKSLPVQSVYVLYTNSTKEPVKIEPVGQAFAYVSGPPNVLENLDVEKDVKLFIEISDENVRTYEIKFWCNDPGVSKVKITPSKVTLSDLAPKE